MKSYIRAGVPWCAQSSMFFMVVVSVSFAGWVIVVLPGCGNAPSSEGSSTEVVLQDGGVVQEASSGEQEPKESTLSVTQPLQWKLSTYEKALDQGRPYVLSLPQVSGGLPPYSYEVLGLKDGRVSLKERQLHVTLPYEEKSSAVSLQVVVTDQKQQAAHLLVKLAGFKPRFEKIALPETNAPKARANPAVALAGETILVFGGYLPNGQGSNDMWMFQRNTKTWTLAKASGTLPLAYGAHRMAIDRYDSDTQTIKGVVFQGMSADATSVDAAMYRFVLVGGNVTWSKLPYSGQAPSSNLVLSSFGYDVHHKRFVLFGGIEFQFGESPTAVYTMRTQGGKAVWEKHELSNHPGQRYGSLFAMDPAKKRFLIASGDTQRPGLERFPGDLWSLSLGEKLVWKKLAIGGSYPGRRNGVMLVDAPANRVFLWGGSDGRFAPVDLNVVCLDASKPTWESVPGESPEARTSTAGDSDPSSGAGFLGFGRSPTFLRDFWRLQTHVE
ncbi:MAG: hypothetical protein EP343_08870 [Deltaproteobacteria bacterium]|nr:MAG: hypothetical protein EP343_08870 [Deltaproteobacteria bacterium]